MFLDSHGKTEVYDGRGVLTQNWRPVNLNNAKFGDIPSDRSIESKIAFRPQMMQLQSFRCLLLAECILHKFYYIESYIVIRI